MCKELFDRLDEIKQKTFSPFVDTDALEIMLQLMHTPTGFEELIRRYKESNSIYIISSLTSLLAVELGNKLHETFDKFKEQIKRLTTIHHAESFMIALSAIQRQLSWKRGITQGQFQQLDLNGFLKHCLNYSGRQEYNVWISAIEVLVGVGFRELLYNLFSIEQIDWFKDKAEHLSRLNSEIFYDECKLLLECMTTQAPNHS
jgi:hypothetical protein